MISLAIHRPHFGPLLEKKEATGREQLFGASEAFRFFRDGLPLAGVIRSNKRCRKAENLSAVSAPKSGGSFLLRAIRTFGRQQNGTVFPLPKGQGKCGKIIGFFNKYRKVRRKKFLPAPQDQGSETM